MSTDTDSPDYNDTNVGEGFLPTPEEGREQSNAQKLFNIKRNLEDALQLALSQTIITPQTREICTAVLLAAKGFHP